MKEKIAYILFGSLAFTITLFGCLGCASISKSSNKIIKTTTGEVIKKDNTLFPIESFVMTRQKFKLTSRVCDDKKKTCEINIHGVSKSVASGVIVKTNTENSYILTAGHVCVPPPPKNVKGDEVKITYDITVKTGYGRISEADLVAVDTINDLCLLSAPVYLGPGLSIQERETTLHTKVYNMASPHGLAASLAVPVFDGYYTGRVADKMLFTIPAAPGSSGSPIMNSNNEIITIISAAAIRFDEFAICPTTDTIRKFLLANIPTKKKKSIAEGIKKKLETSVE